MSDETIVLKKYQKFLKDKNLKDLDEKQDWFLKRFFYAGFTACRDFTILDVIDMKEHDAMLEIMKVDDELKEFWETDG